MKEIVLGSLDFVFVIFFHYVYVPSTALGCWAPTYVLLFMSYFSGDHSLGVSVLFSLLLAIHVIFFPQLRSYFFTEMSSSAWKLVLCQV